MLLLPLVCIWNPTSLGVYTSAYERAVILESLLKLGSVYAPAHITIILELLHSFSGTAFNFCWVGDGNNVDYIFT